MSNIHEDLISESQIHVCKGKTEAEFGTVINKDEIGAQVWEKKEVLKAFLSFTSSIGTPPTESNGDIYILSDGGYGAYFADSINHVGGTANNVRFFPNDPSTIGAIVSIGSFIRVGGCPNPKHNGRFEVVDFAFGGGEGSDYIEYINPAILSSGDDDTSFSSYGFISKSDWDGASVNDWVRFNSENGKWYFIEPQSYQASLNKTDNKIWYFKNDGYSWLSTTYVPPTEDTTKVRLLCNQLFNSETLLTDQTLTLNFEGNPGFTKFYPTEILINANGDVPTLLGDIRLYNGAGRTGNYLFLIGNAALTTLTSDNQSYISLSDGDISKQEKTMAKTTVYLSVGIINGVSLSNARIKVYGVGVQ